MALLSSEPEKSASADSILKRSVAPPPKPAVSSAGRGGASASAYLDSGTRITGKLRFDGHARIDGHVDGEIDGKEITIGESANVSAQIRAESVVVCGVVKGEIMASQRIEIRDTAKVAGNISAPKLIVQEGAEFEGNCAMISQSAPQTSVATPHRTGAPAVNVSQG
jgi:cytoskeletal protein CcmA (bactofilin family)